MFRFSVLLLLEMSAYVARYMALTQFFFYIVIHLHAGKNRRKNKDAQKSRDLNQSLRHRRLTGAQRTESTMAATTRTRHDGGVQGWITNESDRTRRSGSLSPLHATASPRMIRLPDTSRGKARSRRLDNLAYIVLIVFAVARNELPRILKVPRYRRFDGPFPPPHPTRLYRKRR